MGRKTMKHHVSPRSAERRFLVRTRRLLFRLLLAMWIAVLQIPTPDTAVFAKEGPARDSHFFSGSEKTKPKRLPVHSPKQVTFEADPVFYATISLRSGRVVYTTARNGDQSLRLGSPDPARVAVPKDLAPAATNPSAPAISPDGRRIAFVDTGYDVKGDIYVMDLEDPDAVPRRITGRKTEDGAPCFSPDGRKVYFHQVDVAGGQRHIVSLNLDEGEPLVNRLPIDGGGAFPSISPDGKRCAIVSFRDDPAGDIFLFDLESGQVRPLTKGRDLDLFPAWSDDGLYVYFNRIGQDTDKDGAVTPSDRAVVYRVRADGKDLFPHPITSGSYTAYRPMVKEEKLYFLSDRRGVSNLWVLPASGEIPDRASSRAQMELALELAERVPPDLHLAILGYHKVLERFGQEKDLGAKTAYAIGRLQERLNMLDAAERTYALVMEAFTDSQPEAGLSRIRNIDIQTRRRWKDAVSTAERKALFETAFSELDAVEAAHPESPSIQAQARIVRARLITTLRQDAESLLRAIRLLEQVIEMLDAPPDQRAEATLVRADLLSRVGRSESVVSAYVKVLEMFPDQVPWADRAVERILNLRLSQDASGDLESRTRLLTRVAETYRESHPRLAMGAWNRLGDIYFAADEWTPAKDAYRQVLERFPPGATQAAAARLALAEILYRESRFREALDLYESEMASRPYEDSLYALARGAYIRKTVAAGEHLYHLGEVPAARNIFVNLIREDYGVVEAHRGYIKCAAAQREIPEVLARYRQQLGRDSHDPVTLYATGLCLTYLEGKESLQEARSLILQAITLRGEVAYFHQTLGYVFEVLETVHGERGNLEKALESYKKAYFLNDAEENPQNAANLLLNLGNMYFLLGQYAKAFENYTARFESGRAFENEESEIMFYRRFGEAAFQVRQKEEPIRAYARAIDLIEERIDPKRASQVFGRLNRHVFDRIITPALKQPEYARTAESLAERQGALNRRLFQVSGRPLKSPADPAWGAYRQDMISLLSEQEGIIRDVGSIIIPDNREGVRQALAYMVTRVRETLQFPPRLLELKAEMLDRLGLAYQEAGKYSEARQTFERSYALNEQLGLHKNLARNQRSIALNAYFEAGKRSGGEGRRLLTLSAECFQKAIALVRQYGVVERRKEERKGALISLSFDVALDEVRSTQALYGFSAEQEQRLAEAFIARIQTELGVLDPAQEALEKQLARYPPEKPVPDTDLYGVGLLHHRAGHMAYARRRPIDAFEHFRRSAMISQKLENPVSAVINVENMAQSISLIPPHGPEYRKAWSELEALDQKTVRLLNRFPRVLEIGVILSYHNTMGVFALKNPVPLSQDPAALAAGDMQAVMRSGMHFCRGIEWFRRYGGRGNRKTLGLLAALHLNMAEVASLSGEKVKAEEHFKAAAEAASKGWHPEYRWRALAGLGRFQEALKSLESVTVVRYGCGPEEIMTLFAPMVKDLAEGGKAEAGFNLLERLSEMERVQRLTPLAVGRLSEDERIVARRVYPRLVKVEDLKRKLVSAEDSNKSSLSSLLKQEQALLDGELGPNRERLPHFFGLAGGKASGNALMILVGLALHAEEVADEAVEEGVVMGDNSRTRQYDTLVSLFRQVLAGAKGDSGMGEASGIMGMLRPEPAAAIDVMEHLPAGRALYRLFRMPGKQPAWYAFEITSEKILVERTALNALFDGLGEGRHVVAHEDPAVFPAGFPGPVALSATHWVRSFRNRKPFKHRVLVVPPNGTIGAPFDIQSLPPETTAAEIREVLPSKHTLLFGGTAYEASSVPTRPGERPARFMAVSLDQGRLFPLLQAPGSFSNVSLAVLAGGSVTDAYALGHLFSFLGVPTVLIYRSSPERYKDQDLEALFRAYGTASVWKAVQEAGGMMDGRQAWLQLGYRGMSPEEGAAYAKEQFGHYVRSGADAFKAKQYDQALASFENALSVVKETDQLKRYEGDLHKYGRESAYAAGRFDRAIVHARALVHLMSEQKPDSQSHAEAILKMALIEARVEHFEEAIPAMEKAVDMLANLELSAQQVSALGDLGVILENATEYDRALLQFRSAASLSESLNKKGLLARQHMAMGRIHDLRLNRYALALTNYEKGFEIFRELGEKGNMAQALLDMGRCHRLLGNFDEARKRYERALELVEGNEAETRLKAKIVLEQANNAWFQGRYQEAFELQREVRQSAQREGWSLEQVIALNTSGLTWWTLGDHERAVRELEEAFTLAMSLRVRQDEVATTLNNMGLVYRDMGRYEEALRSLERALDIDRRLKSKWAIAYDLRNMALTHLRMGNPERALPLFQEALETAAGIGNRINEAKTLLGLGETLTSLERQDEARGALEKALALSRAMLLRDTEWRALYGLGRLSLDGGRKLEARDLLTRATVVIEGMRAEIKLEQLKDGFIADKMAVYETLVPLLVDLGMPNEAFDMAERSRARNLIDLLGNQRLNLKGNVENNLYERERRLRARVREQEALVAQAETESEKTVYGRMLERLNDEYRDLLLDIQLRDPNLASIVSVNPLKIEEIQDLLDPETALLAFYVVSNEVLCWLLRPNSVQLFRTPLGRDTLEASILSYRRMIQNLEPSEKASKELYAWLMSQVISHIGDVKTLGIVPHGALHYLSFATLYDGKEYVVDRFALFYLPSASVFRHTKARRGITGSPPGAHKTVRVLAVGNPDLGDPALDLPFASHEVGTIGWNFPRLTLLTREKATESWIIDHIEEFGIIHLASHGEFNAINPLFSALKLVKDSREDGDLEASEVFGIRLNADLVVLSACQTGLGKVTSGDDVIGLNRSFLFAGTHAIISSLWRVSDISTGILVKRFYREYTRRAKADSLRWAMLHVKSRYAHPGYWGAFVLVGDYY